MNTHSAFYVCSSNTVLLIADSYEEAKKQGKVLLNSKITPWDIAVSDVNLKVGDEVKCTHNLYEVDGCKYLLDFVEPV